MSISAEPKKRFRFSAFKFAWFFLFVLSVYIAIAVIRESNRPPEYTYEYSVLVCTGYNPSVNGVSHCKGSLIVNVKSHLNPFAVSFPNQPGFVHNNSRSASTAYSNSLPLEKLPHIFNVNGINFVMTATELQSGAQIWPIHPGEPVEVNVDELATRLKEQFGKN